MASQPPGNPAHGPNSTRQAQTAQQRPYWEYEPSVPFPARAQLPPPSIQEPEATIECVCPCCGAQWLQGIDTSQIFDIARPDEPSQPQKRVNAPRRSPKEKVFAIMALISSLRLTLGTFLVYVFTPGYFGFNVGV